MAMANVRLKSGMNEEFGAELLYSILVSANDCQKSMERNQGLKAHNTRCAQTFKWRNFGSSRKPRLNSFISSLLVYFLAMSSKRH